MKKLTFILFIVQFTLFSMSCAKYDSQIEISKLNEPRVITLQKKPEQKDIYSMRIHCYGRLEGEAQLVLMLNDAPYKTEHMSGKVNFTWGGDWYSDSMELRYQPSSTTSGQLVLEYAFSDL